MECEAVLWECRAAEEGRQAFGTHTVYWETFFVNPDVSSSALYRQELHQWSSSIEEPLHSSSVEKSERQKQDQDLRCQSGPSAKDSVIFSGRDTSKNYGADQQRLQILDLHFDKFPTPATFACWKIRFKTGVCTSSQFSTEAMQWIKEVEMVESVIDLKSSSSIRDISMPKFEVLDARNASALNKIIHNSHFKRRISLDEQKAKSRTVSFAEGRLYINTKTQLADILTKGNFTRDEWNHLLCLFNISLFSLTVCFDTVAKRSQQDSGGERVTAKSRAMMNLIARTLSHVSSSTSVSREKIAGVQLQRKRRDRCDLIKAHIYLKPPIIIAISNSWKASLQQVIQNGMITVLGLLKSGKLRLRRTSDRDDLIKLFGK